jgi:Ca-activated chloride channel homolog
MHAHDFEHEGRLVSRLEMVKLVISQFIDNRPHDRVGMLVFAEEPFLISPLTRNHSWLKTLFQRIEIGMIEPNATAIGDAIGMAVNHLRGLEGDGKILILLSDGENNAGMLPPGLAGELALRFGIKVYTVGVGKSGSVLMPRHRGGQIIKDRDGHPVMDWVHEDMDEFGLREVAQVSGGRFFRATHAEALANIYTEIDKLEKRETTMVRFDESKDLMMFPLGLALLLLFLEIVLSRTLLHKIP